MTAIPSHDYGKLVLEDCQKLDINALVRQYHETSKTAFVQAYVEAGGHNIQLVTSGTNYGGKRLWFGCPLCMKRVGVLYIHPVNTQPQCRHCVGLSYKVSRFKGMIEE